MRGEQVEDQVMCADRPGLPLVLCLGMASAGRPTEREGADP